MPGTTMSHGPWSGAAAGYLGMWIAMMVPMMLPALVPPLSWYRRSVRGASRLRLHGLTALVCLGYFAVWAAIGAAAGAVGAGVMAVEMRWERAARWLPVAAGVVLLLSGAVQLTAWKARQLAHCREGPRPGRTPAPTVPAAWRHGLGLGARCSLSCGSLMLPLLAVGVMEPAAMAAVTLVIAAERLAPDPARVVRAAGVAILLTGVLTIASAQL